MQGSSHTQFHPYQHAQFVAELQLQKRQAFDAYIDRMASNALQGAIAGFALNLILLKGRKPFHMMGLFSGLGCGIATNQVAAEFNRIEGRELRITNSINKGDSSSFLGRAQLRVFDKLRDNAL